MKRDDFLFTIGFSGGTAIVDKANGRKYGSAGTAELFDHGFYKASFCSALYSGDPADERTFLDLYNRMTNSGYTSVNQLKKVFGVFGVPDGIKKIKRL